MIAKLLLQLLQAAMLGLGIRMVITACYAASTWCLLPCSAGGVPIQGVQGFHTHRRHWQAATACPGGALANSEP